MYYGIILLAVVFFGGCFALNDVYRRLRGSSLRISMESAFIGSCAGLIVLLAAGGLHIEITLFTLVMALLSSLNGLAFTFCAFRALDRINLSLFSLFSMLGGMVLPFLQGILFFNEPLTWGKCICLAFITVALTITVSRGNQRGGAIYYIGIFVLNGMAGVLSKIFTAASFPKTDAASFNFWCAVFSGLLAGAIWLILTWRKKPQDGAFSWRATAVGAVSGATNRLANLLLVMALAHVDASVQYPMVTGGVMIASTLICLLGKRKPSTRDVLSVLLAFLGMLALFAIPV